MGGRAVSDDMEKTIPENWYLKTEAKLVCLHCNKTFKREYKPKKTRRAKPHGAKVVLSLWAWYNFKRHLLRCWHQ